MAKLNNGLGGSPRGKIGSLVGFELNGRNYIKTKAKRTAPPTEGELKNQFVFELVQNWLQPLLEVVRVGFRNYAPTFEGSQAAISHLYKEALNKNGYESSIEPSLVKISYGSLELSEELQVVYIIDLEALNFSWNPLTAPRKGPRDRVLLLAYNQEKGSAFYELSGAQRREGFAFLPLPAAPSGIYHIYAAFVAEDRSNQSESSYLGSIHLPPEDRP